MYRFPGSSWRIRAALPDRIDDAIWPLTSYLAGKASPDRVPPSRDLAAPTPTPNDLCGNRDAYRNHRVRSQSALVLSNADVLHLTRPEMAALRATQSRAQAIWQTWGPVGDCQK